MAYFCDYFALISLYVLYSKAFFSLPKQLLQVGSRSLRDDSKSLCGGWEYSMKHLQLKNYGNYTLTSGMPRVMAASGSDTPYKWEWLT